MIGTIPKPFEDVMAALDGYKKIAVVGCDGCAKVCGTGGSEQVSDMTVKLIENGKHVVFTATPSRTCVVENSSIVLDPHKDDLKETEAVFILGCGGAVQIVRQIIEDYGLTIPVKVGLESVGHMDTLIMGELAIEQCQECGECILNETGAICPVTKCAKSLLNGPCGGAQNGKCEVDPERDCAWVMIYNRMLILGELDKLRRFIDPKDYSKMLKPRRLNIRERKVE